MLATMNFRHRHTIVSASPWSCSVLTTFCCTTVFQLRTSRTVGHSRLLAFLICNFWHTCGFVLVGPKIIISQKEGSHKEVKILWYLNLIVIYDCCRDTGTGELSVNFLRELGVWDAALLQHDRQTWWSPISEVVGQHSHCAAILWCYILHDSFSPCSDLWPPME